MTSTPRRFSVKALIRPLVAVVILMLGFAGFNLLVATKPEVQSRPRLEEARKISAAIVKVVSAQPDHRAFGTVEAARSADLRFAVGGEVAQVSADMKNGMVVKKGTVLAELDTELLQLAREDIITQMDAEQVNLEELSTQLDLRLKQYERVNEMAAAAVASEKQLDEARLSLSVAKNAHQQALARLKQLETNLKRSSRNLRDAKLTAPFDGVLSDVVIGEGRVLSSANTLGVITDLTSLEVSFVVPAEIYATSGDLIGRDVAVTWKAGGRDVNTVMATIERAEGNVDASEGGGRLYAALPHDEQRVLSEIPAGAFVEIKYPSLKLDNIIILPESALFDHETVYAVVDNRADRRKVDVVQKLDGVVYLRGDLADGEEIIITRLPGLGEGTLVEVVTTEETGVQG
ncbi:MAG: efflux RND transporter periplasmic adaptor subunit [Alphaproteobacteria bacterium]|nr:efflux RND transporter periplasmic adaptor subunit [Alphaproteobacteria bacterium]